MNSPPNLRAWLPRKTETWSTICKLPSGPVILGQFPPKRKLAREKGLIRSSGKPKNRGSVTPVLMPYANGFTLASTERKDWAKRLYPTRNSLTSVDVGVQVQLPSPSCVRPCRFDIQGLPG